MEEIPKNLFCSTCNKTLTSQSQFLEHIAGEKHKKTLRKNASSTATPSGIVNPCFAADQNIASKPCAEIDTKNNGIGLESALLSSHSTLTDIQKSKTCTAMSGLQGKSVKQGKQAVSMSDFYCSLCRVQLWSKSNFETHCSGKKHQQLIIASEQQEETFRSTAVWALTSIIKILVNKKNEKIVDIINERCKAFILKQPMPEPATNGVMERSALDEEQILLIMDALAQLELNDEEAQLVDSLVTAAYGDDNDDDDEEEEDNDEDDDVDDIDGLNNFDDGYEFGFYDHDGAFEMQASEQ